MKYLSLILIAMVFSMACFQVEKKVTQERTDQPDINNAVAVLYPLGNSGINGTVTFTQEENGVRVEATVNGLSNGMHGFHIHQFGNCTAPDGTSAGGHFNPYNNEHNGPEANSRHMGDMGNLVSQGSGEATTYSSLDKVIDLPMIVGRGVVIHAQEDDLSSQPSGEAGKRIACGVIGIAE